MRPPAPVWFSTMTLCPSVSPSGWAISRAATSVGPPGGNGTTILITRLG